MCGIILFRYDIRSTTLITKQSDITLLGVYTGIFAMYLQYCASTKDASKRNNTIFYALCLLYLLSLSIILLDFLVLFIPVSKDEHLV